MDKTFVSPHFLIRITALPLHSIERLHCKNSVERHSDLEEMTRRFKEASSELVDQLSDFVPQARDDSTRKLAIELKRDIFNDRLPNDRTRAGLDCLPASLCRAVDKWLAERQTLMQAWHTFDQTYTEELLEARRALRALASDPLFINGVVLSSTDCTATLLHYLATPPELQNGRQNKNEHSIVEYLTRTITKTSPLGTFTAVASGTWSTSRAADIPMALSRRTAKSLVRVNHVILHRLFHAYTRHPAIRPNLTYRLNPSARRLHTHLVGTVLKDDPAKQPRTFRNLEQAFALPCKPAVESVISATVAAASASVSYRTLCATVSQLHADGNDEAAMRFLNQLIDSGVLEPAVQLADQRPDMLADLLDEVAGHTDDLSAQLRPMLERLVRLRDSYADISGEARFHQHRAIQSTVTEAASLLNIEVSNVGSVLFEDTSVEMENACLNLDAWAETLVHLDHFRRLQPLFDTQIRFQLAAAAHFAERYGEGGSCDDIFPFLKDTLQMFEDWAHDATILQEWRLGQGLPVVQELNALAAEFNGAVTSSIRTDQPVVHLSPELLTGFVRRIPEAVQARWTSHSIFAQVARQDAYQWLVVNHLYAGAGQFFSRFLPLLGPEWPQAMQDNFRHLFGRSALVVELPGTFGFNANIHRPLAPFELRYPGIPSVRPDRELVDLSDVRFVHDVEQKRLRVFHKETNQEVQFLYLGFLVPFVLPPAIRVLATLFGQGMGGFDPHGHAQLALTPEDRQQIQAYPRLMVGNVVLARRTWYVPPEQRPVPEPHETDAHFFARVQDWRKQAGLPYLGFMRQIPRWLLYGPHATDESPASFGSKPQFMDFANPLLVRLFGKLARNFTKDVFEFTEMLPGPDEQLVHGPSGAFVSELVLELNSPGVDLFICDPRGEEGPCGTV